MVLIPEKRMLIERKIEDTEFFNDFRENVGGSAIGKSCIREIWYDFRWSQKIKIQPRLHRLFNRGHMEEIVVIEDLINAGCNVEFINIDKSIHERFQNVFGIILPEHKQKRAFFAYGFGSGSCDGIIYNLPDSPKTPHLLEVKTHNDKSFKDLKAKGVELSKFVHYVQMQVYMKIHKLKRALYIAVNKNDDERHYERIKYNKLVANKYLEIAQNIVKSLIPPKRICENIEKYPCIFCKNKNVCFGLCKPEKNCRTCKNILFKSDGKNASVICSIKNKKLNYQRQLKGCKNYLIDTIAYV